MSRPDTGARDRIVGATLSLLRRGGLAASGVNTVVAEGNAPKGSLYHYFPGGKDQMVAEALEKYKGAVAAAFRTTLGTGHPLPRRVKTLFKGLANAMAKDGYASSCAVGAVTLDIGPENGVLRAACQQALTHWADVIAECLPELPPGRRRPAGEFLVTLLEGAQLAARAQKSGAPLENAEEAYLLYLGALMA